MSVCISEPWATYSKQLTGHKFCIVCGGNLFVGDGVYPPRGGGGGGRHLATVPPGLGGEPSFLGGDGHGGRKVLRSTLQAVKYFTKDKVVAHGILDGPNPRAYSDIVQTV